LGTDRRKTIVFAETAAQRAEGISKNMLTDRVVRILDTPIAGQLEHLKNASAYFLK
jgi:trimethylamine:corrinoid methyltransferase-like protein